MVRVGPGRLLSNARTGEVLKKDLLTSINNESPRTTLGEFITLNVSKDEVHLLRDTVNIKLRCDAIYSLHRYRKSPSMSDIVFSHGRRVDFKAARDVLEGLGLLVKGNYHVGVHAATWTPPATNEAYTFTPDMDEYELIHERYHHQANANAKRVRKVQNLDGVYFDNISDFEEMLKVKSNELLELKVNGGSEKQIKKMSYVVHSIQKVLSGKIEVNTWRQFKCKRLYSDLTNLPKELKRHIRSIQGDFFEVDIKASQPRLIRNGFINMLETYDSFDFLTGIKNKEITCSYSSMELMKEFHFWKIEVLKELDQFNELTKNDFYSEISSRFKNLTREEMKTQFMWYFFDYNLKLKDHGFAFNKFMFDNFPRINEFVRGLKKANRFSKFKKNQYSISSNLARCESELILETICSKFLKEHKKANLFTIHDSINVVGNDLKDLIEIMKEAYAKANVHLSYKIKNLRTGEEINENDIIFPGERREEGVPSIVADFEEKEPLIRTEPFLIPTNSINTGVVSDSLSAQNHSLSAQNRNRVAIIRELKDGRYTISVKNKNINSRKGESLDQFKERVKL